MFKEGRALSVKCSSHTLDLLYQLFKNNEKFINFEKHGVVLNPSWFFKFSACYTLENLIDSKELYQFAYNCHFGNFLDDILRKENNYSLV